MPPTVRKEEDASLGDAGWLKAYAPAERGRDRARDRARERAGGAKRQTRDESKTHDRETRSTERKTNDKKTKKGCKELSCYIRQT